MAGLEPVQNLWSDDLRAYNKIEQQSILIKDFEQALIVD